jgi:hypothetical protein
MALGDARGMGEVKGKQANVVGSQYSSQYFTYSLTYLLTLLLTYLLTYLFSYLLACLLTYEVCPESIQPYLISREPVA